MASIKLLTKCAKIIICLIRFHFRIWTLIGWSFSAWELSKQHGGPSVDLPDPAKMDWDVAALQYGLSVKHNRCPTPCNLDNLGCGLAEDLGGRMAHQARELERMQLAKSELGSSNPSVST